MKFGLIGPSYTARSSAIADEECINWFAEVNETPGAQSRLSYFGTPGLRVFSADTNGGPFTGSINANGRVFGVDGDKLYEIASDGTRTSRGTLDSDGNSASIAASNIQLLIVTARRAWCYTLATNALVEVTASLAGVPLKVCYSDGYFITQISGNKFQMSDLLDGTSWPGLYVNAVSVFPEDIVSIIVSHRELWVMGARHIQPYQNTGSNEIFDAIPGALMEIGICGTFACSLLDNTVFWVHEDDRGGRSAWRGAGYTPQRISTHAVEYWLSQQADVSGLVAYSYQQDGHEFWVLYVPGGDCSWVYDVSTGFWHKRDEWKPESATSGPHRSWNHVYAFGKHLVGDWKTGNLYELAMDAYDDNGETIRRVRRSPIVGNEMQWIYHNSLTLDFDTGQGPQPQLTDGDGNPRPPQCMLRWSDDRGKTWGNSHILDCGYAGEYKTRAIKFQLGRSRYRVYEVSVSDPIPWYLVDGYLQTR